jgi:hypothetical protein
MVPNRRYSRRFRCHFVRRHYRLLFFDGDFRPSNLESSRPLAIIPQ